MNVGVRLEEKEQEKEREDELKRMIDEVELKEKLQMKSFLKDKEKENRSFEDNKNLQEKETDGLSLYQCGSRKKLGAQCGTSLNDGTDGELINNKNQDKNITDKVSDSKDQHKKLFTYTELHAQKHDSSELDVHIERLANLHQSIPPQIQYTVFKILTINLLIMDAIFTNAHVNTVMSDIYQSLLIMVKFVSGRMIAPNSKNVPVQDLELSISANGCFKKLGDMSSNRTKLMELLSCVGEYAVSVAHRGYFESKQITRKHEYDEITEEDDEAKMSYDAFYYQHLEQKVELETSELCTSSRNKLLRKRIC
ncbi:MAG: hypothetical protein EZS28_040007 [Streblomastix strix]|uniref:Uncharacterized protein n=1 Tax=Streblomastix strix TaxID=222440 RepID=A0A5J4U483_9EUKA|nr:MAG: hypothetical protein EZS28_040007 [Streblomastix strix]